MYITDLTELYVKLSILPACCNKSVKIRFVATRHLQTCYNLLKQLAASLWVTSFDNKLVTNLLTTCKKIVINKLSYTCLACGNTT